PPPVGRRRLHNPHLLPPHHVHLRGALHPPPPCVSGPQLGRRRIEIQGPRTVRGRAARVFGSEGSRTGRAGAGGGGGGGRGKGVSLL
ncbi:hypothetical protein LTR16_007059, partial [Cryomyces antarcticus]